MTPDALKIRLSELSDATLKTMLEVLEQSEPLLQRLATSLSHAANHDYESNTAHDESLIAVADELRARCSDSKSLRQRIMSELGGRGEDVLSGQFEHFKQ